MRPDMKEKAPLIGLVLGTVFIIMGFGSGNSAIWMLGFIVLAIGLVKHKKNR